MLPGGPAHPECFIRSTHKEERTIRAPFAFPLFSPIFTRTHNDSRNTEVPSVAASATIRFTILVFSADGENSLASLNSPREARENGGQCNWTRELEKERAGYVLLVNYRGRSYSKSATITVEIFNYDPSFVLELHLGCAPRL